MIIHCLHILPGASYCQSFYYSHMSGCEVITHHGLFSMFPLRMKLSIFFICFLAISTSSIEKCLFKSFFHWCIRLSSYCWVERVLYIFWILDTFQIIVLQLFPLILGVVLFTSLLAFFEAQKILIFMKLSLSIHQLFFSSTVIYKTSLCNQRSQRFMLFFNTLLWKRTLMCLQGMETFFNLVSHKLMHIPPDWCSQVCLPSQWSIHVL